MATIDVRQSVLDFAQELLPMRGFHAFSRRDVAERAGERSSLL